MKEYISMSAEGNMDEGFCAVWRFRGESIKPCIKFLQKFIQEDVTHFWVWTEDKKNAEKFSTLCDALKALFEKCNM